MGTGQIMSLPSVLLIWQKALLALLCLHPVSTRISTFLNNGLVRQRVLIASIVRAHRCHGQALLLRSIVSAVVRAIATRSMKRGVDDGGLTFLKGQLARHLR